jgi:hypothetical protein
VKARALLSTLTSDSHIRISLDDVDLGDPGPDEVIVRVDATPVNPTDLALMLSGADLAKATASPGALRAPVPSIVLSIFPGRIDKPIPLGTEGSGTVVAAGASPAAQALVGKLVATSGGMFASHRKCPVGTVRELPPGATAEDGASSFVNPLTALSFVETMRAEGHKAIVHTAAASNLGQMSRSADRTAFRWSTSCASRRRSSGSARSAPSTCSTAPRRRSPRTSSRPSRRPVPPSRSMRSAAARSAVESSMRWSGQRAAR